MLPRVLAVLSFVLFVTSNAVSAEPTWPRWRGPEGTGHSTEKDIPAKWDTKSILWKTPLKGSGQSTPTIWGDKMFLTTALENGKSRVVFCVDRKKGDIVWEKVAWTGEPEVSHVQNGWASASCVTDGEIVVAFFGKGGLHGYTVDGKHLWSRDLGKFPGPFGTAASPVLHDDLVIQNCEHEGDSFIRAFYKKDGKDVWQTPRLKTEKGGWSTPIFVKSGARTELVLNGEKAICAYDPLKGNQLWSCKAFAGRGDPTATFHNGLIIVVNGLAGDIYAVKPGGNGDVTKTHMAWHTPRKGGRDQPSPILVGNFLLVANMGGMLTCYDATKGSVLWEERMKGGFSSSPIAANGLAYFQNDAGDTTVIEPGDKPNFVHVNTLGASGEVFRASLTPLDGHVYTRSDKVLYCIGKK